MKTPLILLVLSYSFGNSVGWIPKPPKIPDIPSLTVPPVVTDLAKPHISGTGISIPDIPIPDIAKDLLDIGGLTSDTILRFTETLNKDLIGRLNITDLLVKMNKLLQGSRSQTVYTNVAKSFDKLAGLIKKYDVMIPKDAFNEGAKLVNTFITSQEAMQILTDKLVKYGIIMGYDVLSKHTMFNTSSIRQEFRNLFSMIYQANVTEDTLLTMPGIVKAHVPKSAIMIASSKGSGYLSVPFTFYENPILFQKTNGTEFKVKQVLCVNVGEGKLRNLEERMWYEIGEAKTVCETLKNKRKEITLHQCAYWNNSRGDWSTDGCIMVPGSNPARCSCNHMTAFTVLIRQVDLPSDYALDIMAYIGFSISILALMILIGLHLRFKKLRQTQISKIHIHLAVNLIGMYIVMMVGISRPRDFPSCVASAMAIHFFTLSAWGWMVSECITMYRQFMLVFVTITSRYIRQSAAIIYLTSATFALATFILTVHWADKYIYKDWHTVGCDEKPSFYLSPRICWLHNYSLYFGFLLPIGIMFLMNLIGATIILAKITRAGTKQIGETKPQKTNAKESLTRVFFISILLGLTWIFAIPIAATDDKNINVVFSWLFSISNALQGFFLFIFFCYRRTDARNIWLRPIRNTFHNARRNYANVSNAKCYTQDNNTQEQNTTTIA